MLREMIPNLRKAALLWVSVNPQQVLLEKQTTEAAKAAGLELLSLALKVDMRSSSKGRKEKGL